MLTLVAQPHFATGRKMQGLLLVHHPPFPDKSALHLIWNCIFFGSCTDVTSVWNALFTTSVQSGWPETVIAGQGEQWFGKSAVNRTAIWNIKRNKSLSAWKAALKGEGYKAWRRFFVVGSDRYRPLESVLGCCLCGNYLLGEVWNNYTLNP